jgi:hypothetical protein
MKRQKRNLIRIIQQINTNSIDLIPARYVLQERTKASLEVLRALRVLLAKRPCLEALPRAIVVTS